MLLHDFLNLEVSGVKLNHELNSTDCYGAVAQEKESREFCTAVVGLFCICDAHLHCLAE